MKIRFRRSLRDSGPRPVTPRRLAAAQRRINLNNEKVGLFPELQEQHTAEERLRLYDEGHTQLIQGLRDLQARNWRRARAALRTLSAEDREAALELWNEGGCPGEGVYLLAQLNGPQQLSPTERRAELLHLKATGERERAKAQARREQAEREYEITWGSGDLYLQRPSKYDPTLIVYWTPLGVVYGPDIAAYFPSRNLALARGIAESEAWSVQESNHHANP